MRSTAKSVETIMMGIGLSLLAAACNSGERTTPGGPADTHAAAPTARDSSADATASHTHEDEAGGEALLPIMQRLGTSMTAITYGLMTDDTAMIASSAAAIAAHASIAPAELERIHGVLGGEMAEFERLDVEVHDGSVRLQQAAQAGRLDEVLIRLNEVQRGCVACHARFRERLRTSGSD